MIYQFYVLLAGSADVLIQHEGITFCACKYKAGEGFGSRSVVGGGSVDDQGASSHARGGGNESLDDSDGRFARVASAVALSGNP